jgi:hypothetical protein
MDTGANIKQPGFEENVMPLPIWPYKAALESSGLAHQIRRRLELPSVQRLHPRLHDGTVPLMTSSIDSSTSSRTRLSWLGWDVLKEIQSVVEACYSGWYLTRLAMCWDSFMPGADGLLANWSVENVSKQQHFHSNFVKPILRSNPKSRVFVIVSDALRYEVAEELTRSINATTRFKAKLDSQLGVLPSYTALGMAALLPHNHYGYKNGSTKVVVDGMPCGSFDQRNAVLANHEGMAMRAGDDHGHEQGPGPRSHPTVPPSVIYHDQIDSCGDHAASEGKTFHAARTAIEELTALVKFIVNSSMLAYLRHRRPRLPVSGPAYHGPGKERTGGETQRRSQIQETLHRRQDMGQTDKAWVGTTANTAETNPALEFWIPKGINRFHFSGGARFVHGGAMPQEVHCASRTGAGT